MVLMYTCEIEKILRRCWQTSPYYIGCFAADQIPRALPWYPCCMVVNTDPSSGQGTHWVALFVNSNLSIEYYDPLGVWPPISPYISEYLASYKEIKFNKEPLQNINSITCGPHVIFFLYQRCKGIMFDEFVWRLCHSKVHPDQIVTEFLKQHIFVIP